MSHTDSFKQKVVNYYKTHTSAETEKKFKVKSSTFWYWAANDPTYVRKYSRKAKPMQKVTVQKPKKPKIDITPKDPSQWISGTDLDKITPTSTSTPVSEPEISDIDTLRLQLINSLIAKRRILTAQITLLTTEWSKKAKD